MKLYCQIKELKRFTNSSNDIEYTLRLTTNTLPSELFNIGSQELIEVNIERIQNG